MDKIGIVIVPTSEDCDEFTGVKIYKLLRIESES